MTPSSPETYSRSNIMAMLSALPFEEKKWALNYLVNIIVVPPVAKATRDVAFRGTAAECRRHLESLCVKSGEAVPADIDDFGILAQKYV